MVNKLRLGILFIFFSFVSLFLNAQEHQFVQKLSWQNDENVFYYEVEIKSEDEIFYKKLETDLNFVEVSLSSGNYKYRVFAYDFLGREADVSSWQKFTILKAQTPKIIETKKIIIPDLKDENIKIAVNIENLENDSEVSLVNSKTNEEISGNLEIKINSENNLVATNAIFPKVKEGNWKLKITNPGGLYSESEIIKIEKEKDFEEEKRLAEEKQKLEEEKRLAEEKQKLEEEKRLAEEKQKLEEEKRLAEEKQKLEEEKRLAEEKLKLEEEKRLAEEKRKLEEEKQILAVKKSKPAKDISLIFGGRFLFEPFDGDFSSLKDYSESSKSYHDSIFWQTYFNLPFVRIMDFRFCFLPFKTKQWKFGFELAGQFLETYKTNEYINVKFPIIFADFNFVVQKRLFTDKLYFALKFGPSAILVTEIVEYKKETSRSALNSGKFYGELGVQTGISFVFIPLKHFSFEIGADCNQFFVQKSTFGCVSPYIDLGVRL